VSNLISVDATPGEERYTPPPLALALQNEWWRSREVIARARERLQRPDERRAHDDHWVPEGAADEEQRCRSAKRKVEARYAAGPAL